MNEVVSASTMSPAMTEATAYFDWVYSSLASHVGAGTVLEIGSGHGIYSRKLARRASKLIVSDIDPNAIARIRRELADLPNVEYRVMSGADGTTAEDALQTVFLVNVLEHIEDDVGTLRSCANALRPGGRVLLFVPAFPLLYSRMDSEAGHFRRYTRDSLARAIREAGLEPLEVRYFNSVGFFGWLVNKLLRTGLAGEGANAQIRAFDALVPIIRRVDRLLPFLGQSLVAVASRK